MSPRTLRRARALLADRAGVALDERRDDALASALGALAARLGAEDEEAALDACERAPLPGGPLDALVRALLIRETHVFRTREHFDALERVVLPDVLERRRGDRRLRAWSAGCATGEETWSVAFALTGAAAEAGIELEGWNVALLGTDVDPDSLDTARKAEYREYSFRGVTRAERERYFERVGECWRVRDPWKGMASFRRHDLVRDPAPLAVAGADVILCRNVLMYFTPEAARKVLLALFDALSEDGWLLVGAAEHGLVQGLPLELHALPDALAYRRRAGAAQDATSAPPPWPHSLAGRPAGSSSPSPQLGPVVPIDSAADALDAARAALVLGNRHRAAELAVTALEANADDADACLFLGRLAADGGRGREAEAWLRRACVLRPDDPDALHLLALLAREAGDPAEAARLAARAVGLRPHFVMALQLLARARRESGDERGAASALEEAWRALEAYADDATVPHAHDLTASHVRSALQALRAGATPGDDGGRPGGRAGGRDGGGVGGRGAGAGGPGRVLGGRRR